MITEFTKTAVLRNGYYDHFGIRPELVSLYGDKVENIVTVIMKISDDQSLPDLKNKSNETDYWVWYDNELGFTDMLYPQRFLLDMCFPYGIKSCEDKNQGKAYRVEILEIKK